MAIAFRRTRMGLVGLALLALLAALALAGSVGVQEASAHGSCSNQKQAPFKTSGGRIKGTNQYVCTDQHAEVTGCVRLERETPGGWVTVGNGTNCRTNAFSRQSPQVGTTAACSQTAYYRTVGVGKAFNSDGELVHRAMDTSEKRLIDCSPGDLTNVGGVFDDIGALTG